MGDEWERPQVLTAPKGRWQRVEISKQVSPTWETWKTAATRCLPAPLSHDTTQPEVDMGRCELGDLRFCHLSGTQFHH